ncbi:MaoC family dehydratase [Rathayibacter sp. VKM Ac-2878]|nr:MaoC family dehydratase [Rathayibacter sp. VKM Ac-2878]
MRCRLREVRSDARGAVVTVDSVLLSEAGDEIAFGVSTVLLGGVDPEALRTHLDGAGQRVPAPAARPRAGAPVVSATVPVSAAFSALYAGVSGDDNPLHLDARAARGAGFDGPIAHGMSVVALALEVAADAVLDGDLSRIRSVGVRFSAPVLCGSELAVDVVPAEDPSVLVLRARTPGGPALKAAWIGIAPALERSGA